MNQLENENLYQVGGAIRDRLLGIKYKDIDYCYEGDAISFAKDMEILQTNQDFGTVRVLYEDKEIDIASTREETYPQPGKLPVVTRIGCSIEEDLKRRDFTINSMARRTSDGKFIDPFNGLGDLEERKIRVLHERSFIDDPTRIIRALKFSVRLGFNLAKNTKRIQDEYLENINYNICWHRMKKELVETFSLNKQKAFNKFIKDGLYKLLGPNQTVPVVKSSIEAIVKQYPTKYSWLVYLGLFDLSNLELTRAEKKILEWAERLKTEKPSNNTPFESLLIYRLRLESLDD